MKNTFFPTKLISLCVLIVLLSGSCSNKDQHGTNVLPTAPEAKAEHDHKSGGIYKGALIGSSGTVKVVLQEGRTEVILTIDGNTKNLAPTDLRSWTSGQAIQEVEFRNEDWKVAFSVKGDGSDPFIDVDIAGHPYMVVVLLKETSNQLVKVYEGTYTSPDVTPPHNNWNFVARGASVYGIRSGDAGDVEEITGVINGNSVTGSTTSGASFSGTFSSENVSGTWTNGSENGNWSGTRKL